MRSSHVTQHLLPPACSTPTLLLTSCHSCQPPLDSAKQRHGLRPCIAKAQQSRNSLNAQHATQLLPVGFCSSKESAVARHCLTVTMQAAKSEATAPKHARTITVPCKSVRLGTHRPTLGTYEAAPRTARSERLCCCAPRMGRAEQDAPEGQCHAPTSLPAAPKPKQQTATRESPFLQLPTVHGQRKEHQTSVHNGTPGPLPSCLLGTRGVNIMGLGLFERQN